MWLCEVKLTDMGHVWSGFLTNCLMVRTWNWGFSWHEMAIWGDVIIHKCATDLCYLTQQKVIMLFVVILLIYLSWKVLFFDWPWWSFFFFLCSLQKAREHRVRVGMQIENFTFMLGSLFYHVDWHHLFCQSPAPFTPSLVNKTRDTLIVSTCHIEIQTF